MTQRKFSILQREEDLMTIRHTTFDLTVVGGGITGAGIALDAASRGMNVLLLEKGDFASGTSSKSTKLIHGGLRYLKQFEFGLVKETGTERAIVHRLAPHLAVPEKMLLPFVTDGTYGSISTSLGLKVYDFLADVVKKDKRQMLSKVKTLAAEPLLNHQIVEGGGVYSEYRTDDARLTLEVLKTAHRYEGVVLNYAEVLSFTYQSGKVSGLVFQDYINGKKETVKSRCTVAAVGPWLDELLGKDGDRDKKLRLTKGVHLVVPKEKFPIRQPVYFDTPDQRMIFAIPRGKTTYIGTTDTEYYGDLNRVVTNHADVDYLLGALARVFPSVALSKSDVISSWAGLRPLIDEEGKSPSELSRKDETYELDDGLIAIAGGKLTGYRRMAERIIDMVQERLDMPHKIKCRTSMIPLTEAPLANFGMVEKAIRHYGELAEKEGLDQYTGWHLIMTYGGEAARIWRKFIESKERGEEALLSAELWYAIHFEMVTSMADFFVRRTGRLYFDMGYVQGMRAHVLAEMSHHFKWTRSRKKDENKKLDQLILDAISFPDPEDSK